MSYKVPFVEPVKVYRMIKKEIDAAYFTVMEKGILLTEGN
jgi:hypothetical protein